MDSTEWREIAGGDPDELRERILTGYKDGKPFTPYVPTLPLAPVETVLDFGCGIGRSFPYLKRLARRVECYDLPPMVARCRELANDPVDAYWDDWREVRARSYDLVFASLVLQHIETDLCRRYIRDFAQIAPITYVLTRGGTDYGANVLELFAQETQLTPSACAVVNHDDATHQLRVLKTIPFDAARRASADLHFELVLTRA